MNATTCARNDDFGTTEVEHFDQHGWLLTDTLVGRAAEIAAAVEEISRMPADPVLHYRELTDEGPQLCRTEYFTPFHPLLRELLTEGPMLAIASALLGERAVLYKEKINYKLAGGAGYSPHQDAPAYRFVQQHVSCMVAVDEATVENGCLEVVSGMHADLLPTNELGCIADSLVATMPWQTVPLRAGQTLWFHSRTPHRSGANRTRTHRRALYPTYNALSEGDLREDYYAAKRNEFAAAGGPTGRVRVSLIGDFQGRPAD